MNPTVAVGVHGSQADARVGSIEKAAPVIVGQIIAGGKLVSGSGGGIDEVFANVNLVATFIDPVAKIVTRREGKSGSEGGEKVEEAEGVEEVDHFGCCE